MSFSTNSANIYQFKVNNKTLFLVLNMLNMLNVFKGNNEDTRWTSLTSFWYLYYYKDLCFHYYKQYNNQSYQDGGDDKYS